MPYQISRFISESEYKCTREEAEVLKTQKNSFIRMLWIDDQKMISFKSRTKIGVHNLLIKRIFEASKINFDESICYKKCFIPSGENVINITNDGSSINDLWHVINNAKALVTLDSGPLHLAGTTDTWIFQIGSARHPEFNTPYRKGSQDYKHIFIGGECSLFCASNLKYTVREWNNINSIHYLPVCQENYETMRCHPNSDQVLRQIKSIIN